MKRKKEKKKKEKEDKGQEKAGKVHIDLIESGTKDQREIKICSTSNRSCDF